jgi:hypothetical protein
MERNVPPRTDSINLASLNPLEAGFVIVQVVCGPRKRGPNGPVLLKRKN